MSLNLEWNLTSKSLQKITIGQIPPCEKITMGTSYCNPFIRRILKVTKAITTILCRRRKVRYSAVQSPQCYPFQVQNKSQCPVYWQQTEF